MAVKLADATPNSVYMTGWCMTGGHQDKDVLTSRGTLLKRCQGDYTFSRRESLKSVVQCKCPCHDVWRRLKAIQESYASTDSVAIVPSVTVPVQPIAPVAITVPSVAIAPLKTAIPVPMLPFPMPGMVTPR